MTVDPNADLIPVLDVDPDPERERARGILETGSYFPKYRGEDAADVRERRTEATLALYDHLRANPGKMIWSSSFRDVLVDAPGIDVDDVDRFRKRVLNATKYRGNALRPLPGVAVLGWGPYLYRPQDSPFAPDGNLG